MSVFSKGAPMDDLDRELLNRVQSDFPITSRPYASIAGDLGITEARVIDRLKALKAQGIIRRIGGNFVPHKLGFVSTLCAAKVPEEKLESFAETVNRYPGVTHNYTRDNPFNVWFTFIAPSMEEIDANLEAISRETGVREILNLPSTRVFKIRAHFDL
ncbi:MAG: AsnC family transcriptional regulator [Thermodesulfobacteriota bacterium]